MRAKAAAAEDSAATTPRRALTVKQAAGLPTLLPGGTGGRFVVRSARIMIGALVTAITSSVSSPRKGGRIRWSVWTTRQAHGVGALRMHDCIPSAAEGTLDGYRATIDASRLSNGRFTRMTVRCRRARDMRGVPPAPW